ncbi:Golgi-resident adenosine 3',5'-bisphosphate 3'-phosphatase-like [Ornithodoros turicata]|uniref:Golgi-resident adenosine 3',5'-bisphosphate 3'-phosphatase-like n=1 Tax=Ornithodoros turicata TaxID=34597 RepID=UPI003138B5F7
MIPNMRFNRPVIICACCAGLIIIGIYLSSSKSYIRESYDYLASSHASHVSLQELLIVAIAAAERGGNEVRLVRRSNLLSEKSKGKTKEGANDPLTDGDLRSHEVMYHGLSQAFPGVHIISEEHDSTVPDNIPDLKSVKPESVKGIALDDVTVPRERVTVWIDPLDATQEYTENLLNYVTTMVCVAVDGQPVIGVIHKPFMNETAWAWVGHQISSTLKTHSEAKREHPVIIVSRSHAGTVQTMAREVLGPSAEIIPAGGAGYKALEVASGKVDAYIHTTLIKKWDICAGNAVLNALGGHMTTLSGGDLYYGKNDPIKAEGGILATLREHYQYVKKFEALQ